MHVFTNPQTSQLTRRSCIDLIPLEAFHPVPRSATSCAPMHDQLVEGIRLCYTPQSYVRPTGSGIRPADSVPWLHRRFCTIWWTEMSHLVGRVRPSPPIGVGGWDLGPMDRMRSLRWGESMSGHMMNHWRGVVGRLWILKYDSTFDW